MKPTITFLVAIFALITSLPAQTISDFECDMPGGNPVCEGWSQVAGVNTVVNTNLATCGAMPSSGNNFLEVAAAGGAAQPAYTLGSGVPVFPFTSGVSQVNLGLTATSTTIAVDYNWSAFSAAQGGGSFFEILVVDPATSTGSYQLVGTLPPALAGTSTSFLINLISLDASIGGFNLGVADAHEFQIQ